MRKGMISRLLAENCRKTNLIAYEVTEGDENDNGDLMDNFVLAKMAGHSYWPGLIGPSFR